MPWPATCDQAKWRLDKADEYPEDARNQRAGEGLEEASELVAGLDLDDPLLERIIDLHDDADYYILEVFHSREGPSLFFTGIGEEAGRIASRFRFDVPTQPVEAFLTRFVEALEADKADFDG